MCVSCSVLSPSGLWAVPPCAAHVQAQRDLALSMLFSSCFPVHTDLCCQITLDHSRAHASTQQAVLSPLLLKPYQRIATSHGPGLYSALGRPCKQLSRFSGHTQLQSWDSRLVTAHRTGLNRLQRDPFSKWIQVRNWNSLKP